MVDLVTILLLMGYSGYDVQQSVCFNRTTAYDPELTGHLFRTRPLDVKYRLRSAFLWSHAIRWRFLLSCAQRNAVLSQTILDHSLVCAVHTSNIPAMNALVEAGARVCGTAISAYRIETNDIPQRRSVLRRLLAWSETLPQNALAFSVQFKYIDGIHTYLQSTIDHWSASPESDRLGDTFWRRHLRYDPLVDSNEHRLAILASAHVLMDHDFWTPLQKIRVAGILGDDVWLRKLTTTCGVLDVIDRSHMLWAACSSGDLGMVRQMLDGGALLFFDPAPETIPALFRAVTRQFWDVIRYILSVRDRIMTHERDSALTLPESDMERMFLQVAVASGFIVDARTMMRQLYPWSHSTLITGGSVIRTAIDRFDLDMIRMLCYEGGLALVNFESTRECGALAFAVGSRHSNEKRRTLALLLLTYGALPNGQELHDDSDDDDDDDQPTTDVYTPLLAVLRHHEQIDVHLVELLLVAGARANGIHHRDNRFDSALHFATRCPGSMEVLLRQGANVNHHGDQYLTPLMLACQEGREDAVVVLLAVPGLLINETSSGRTALQLAISSKFYSIALRLIHTGAIRDGALALLNRIFPLFSRDDALRVELQRILL